MPDTLPRHFGEILLAMGLVCAACGGDGTEIQPDETLQIFSGNDQTGRVGEPLTDPIVVRVTLDGSAAPGVTVVWSPDTPGSQIVPASVATDADGMASAIWTLGDAPGAHTAQAAVSGANGSPVTFTATALAAEPEPPPASVAVTVRNNSFLSVRNSTSNPAVDTVAAGGTVTWSWAPTADNAHNITSTGSPGFTGRPTVTPPPLPEPFTVTFASPGTYAYYCTLHGQPASGMRGTIVVR